MPRDAPRHWPAILGRVLGEPMLLLLLLAATVYLLLGDRGEAIALLCSVVAIVALAFTQTFRSERALQALRELGSPRARVVRDGVSAVVPGMEVVVGDLLLLEEGDRVAADGLLHSAQDLMLDESMLTGESVPVRRAPGTGGADAAAMVHAGTLVVRGRGQAVVVATGAATAMGAVHAGMRRIRPAASPMQREVRHLVLVFATLGFCASLLVVALHARTHGNLLEALLAGLTLVMANIPEEFPVVVVVFAALGAWRMARQQALVRHAPAIQTLGSVTVLCTDKTGTLTRNRMVVAELAAPGSRGAPGPALSAPLRELLAWAERASPAHPHDPMELAIREALGGIGGGGRAEGFRVIREYPFSPDLPVSTTLWQQPSGSELLAAAKGAPETMMELCGVTGDARRDVDLELQRMAAEGQRVIAVARAAWRGSGDGIPQTTRGFDWRWLGLVGLRDPLREGVPDAVRRARLAGIRVIMLTGDHPATATAIAREAGIVTAGEALPATDLDALDNEAYLHRVRSCNVFARMHPQQKLRLVTALRDSGEVVAMTGDGVNDAPSLLAAHVGIAMGGRGTDVAREASAMVLLDDNFVTVVNAIAAGRAIDDNMRRAVRYIVAVHVPITGLALFPLLLGAPMVLLPLHVVFLELIIDPASTLVFEREPADPGIMRCPPRPPSARLLDVPALGAGLASGTIAFAAVLAAYLVATVAGLGQAQVAAAAFAALVSGNIALVRWNQSAPPPGARARPLFAIIAVGAACMLALALGVPGLSRWFHFAPPPLPLTLLAVALPWLLFAAAAPLRRMRL